MRRNAYMYRHRTAAKDWRLWVCVARRSQNVVKGARLEQHAASLRGAAQIEPFEVPASVRADKYAIEVARLHSRRNDTQHGSGPDPARSRCSAKADTNAAAHAPEASWGRRSRSLSPCRKISKPAVAKRRGPAGYTGVRYESLSSLIGETCC